ncbi:MAG: hypothetical protein JWN86_3617 [Planctomycetota bacterium]|nr:hypothetical protein [Planctomycetota bacterium]
MRGPSTRFLLDRVVIHAPASGRTADVNPDTTPGSAGSAVACSVQETTGSSQGTSRQESESPFGLTRYELLFSADPGVTKADQRIDWTVNSAGTFAAPIVLVAEGAARPARGLGNRWTVSASRRDST